MNCEDFNKIIHELADYKPMQVTVRDAGVSHLALCADCATKLASARILSTGLVVAASAESEEAPAKIKQNLLAAFTALQQSELVKPQAVSKAEVSAVDVNVTTISMGRSRRWWTAAGVGITAVAAVILLAVIVPNWRNTSAPESLPPFGDLKAGLVEDTRPVEIVNPRIVAPSEQDKPGATVKSGLIKRRPLKIRRPEAGNAKETYETVAQNTGEYMPLTYLATSTAIDSGTIVRVELSQSALASLGIRMNFEGTSKSVKADVVIGDDGVAQAIRLVQ